MLTERIMLDESEDRFLIGLRSLLSKFTLCQDRPLQKNISSLQPENDHFRKGNALFISSSTPMKIIEYRDLFQTLDPKF